MTTDKQASRQCVNHWKRMLKLSVEDIRGKKEAPTGDNCAFCEKYLTLIGCRGCPIQRTTGRDYCWETPYEKANDLYWSINFGIHKRLKDFQKAVQKEIDFLEGLEL